MISPPNIEGDFWDNFLFGSTSAIVACQYLSFVGQLQSGMLPLNYMGIR